MGHILLLHCFLQVERVKLSNVLGISMLIDEVEKQYYILVKPTINAMKASAFYFH